MGSRNERASWGVSSSVNDDATKLAEAIEADCHALADRYNDPAAAWNLRGQLDRLVGSPAQTHLTYQGNYTTGFLGQGAQSLETLASVVKSHLLA